jgi:large subunit ribosomal protein L36e
MMDRRLIIIFPTIQKTTARVVKPRVSRTKGHLSRRTAFVRDIVKEVAG